MTDVTCNDCGTDIETTEDVDRESVAQLGTGDQSDGPADVYASTGKQDLFLCASCGAALGVGAAVD